MTDAAKFQFQIVADRMDKREAFYHALEDHAIKHNGEIPKAYQEDWRIWTEVEHRRSWRTRPMLVARLKKAAKMMAKMNRKKK
jgi:hypothetical protein